MLLRGSGAEAPPGRSYSLESQSEFAADSESLGGDWTLQPEASNSLCDSSSSCLFQNVEKVAVEKSSPGLQVGFLLKMLRKLKKIRSAKSRIRKGPDREIGPDLENLFWSEVEILD